MTNPLDSTNPYGIRVVADRAPMREDAREAVRKAFAEGSRKAAEGIDSLKHPRRAAGTAAAAKRAKRAK